MITREPQVYDTISKGGNFWRIVSIENGVITAKRLHGADNGLKHKTGRPLKGNKRQLEARGYHFCDIPPVKVSYQEPKPRTPQEGAAKPGREKTPREDPLKPPSTEPETATERRDAGEKEQRHKEPPKAAESAAQKLAEAEGAERLKEDGERLRTAGRIKPPRKPEPPVFGAFRVRLVSGREHTVTPPQKMTTQEAVRRMAQGSFVPDAYGAYFASEQIESVTPIKERT